MAPSSGQTSSGNTIAILPLGAHEYHGPHLPLETDAIIAEALSGRLAERLNGRVDLFVLPTEPVGYSPEHLDREGTKSLNYSEAVERWLAIAHSLALDGIRKLVLLNAHGGNSPLLTVVATEARLRFKMLCVATSWARFGTPEGWISQEEKVLDIHGGDIETSVMLALRPDLVRLDALADFPSRQKDFAEKYRHLRAYGPHSFGWMMRDLNEDGAAGNAKKASAIKGERLVEHALSGLAELVEDVARFETSLFDHQKQG